MEGIDLPEAGPGKDFERLVVEMPGALVEGLVVGNLRADSAHYYTLGSFVALEVGMLQASLGSEVEIGRADSEIFAGPVAGMARADLVQLSTSDWFVGLGVGTVRAGLVGPRTGTGLDRHS